MQELMFSTSVILESVMDLSKVVSNQLILSVWTAFLRHHYSPYYNNYMQNQKEMYLLSA